MNTNDQGLKLFLASVALGLLGDLALRIFPWGINLSVWLASVLLLLSYFGYRSAPFASFDMRLVLGAALFFGLLVSWRDSAALKLLNLFIVFMSISLAGAVAAGRRIRAATVLDYAGAAGDFIASFLAVPCVKLPRMAKWLKRREADHPFPYLAIVRGLLVAVPLLLVFGWLFTSADAVFEGIVVDIFDFDIRTVFSHVILVLGCMWTAVTIVIVCTDGALKTLKRGKSVSQISRGAIEVNVVLTLVSILFLTFVLVQARYFFGGHERIMSEAGLSYSEYARRGFFELAWVATFTLVLLLACVRFLQSATRNQKIMFNALATVLVALVLTVIGSALHRMDLYVDAYGLTRMRLYVTAFIYWLALNFIWLAATILSDHLRRFAFGFLLSGYAAALILQVMNPDAHIAATNLSRMHEGKQFDAAYAASLSADAVPELVAALPSIPSEYKTAVVSGLNEKWSALQARPSRTWTFSASRARKALSESESQWKVNTPTRF